MKSWYMILWALARSPYWELLRWVLIITAGIFCVLLGIEMDGYNALIDKGQLRLDIDTVHTVRKLFAK